jgi:hypothetical protein
MDGWIVLILSFCLSYHTLNQISYKHCNHCDLALPPTQDLKWCVSSGLLGLDPIMIHSNLTIGISVSNTPEPLTAQPQPQQSTSLSLVASVNSRVVDVPSCLRTDIDHNCT